MTAVETPGAPAAAASAVAPGGGFLLAPVARSGVYSREQTTEDQREMAEAARNFLDTEILPHMEELESWAKNAEGGLLMLDKLRAACELGLGSIELPEEYEGLGLDLTTSLLCSEALCACASFAATLGAHAGIGTLPIAYFGSDEQKAKYLPKLASAELISCYALTEPGNGSDALHGRTTAVLSEDGSHYVLNGQKQFITNASWADLSVVFTNIDGKYSALIVDLHTDGVERGAEEKKMGIRGSSTCGLVFQDVKVPAENLLGKIGDAAKIALNILYVGRLKLGFATMGTAKYAISKTLDFCASRKQFGRPVIEFDAQMGKLAEMAAWTYACDSACYRVIGDIDVRIRQLPEGHTTLDEIAILRQFGLESAIVKIGGSETLSRVLYHAVRMHGGYGFCEEYQVERLARDNVVDTIYEGTNDINRVVMSGALVESAYMGTIPFRETLECIHADLRSGEDSVAATGEYLADEEVRLLRLKRGLTYVTERILIGIGKDVRTEQQVLFLLADAIMALYCAEAAFARTVQLGVDHEQASVRADLVRLALHEAENQARTSSRDALAHVETSTLAEHLDSLDRLFGDPITPAIAIKRRVAEHFIAAGRYDI